MISEFLPGNNEYVATEDIKKGDMVGYIPREMFLTFDEAKKMSTNAQYLRQRNLLDQMISTEYIPLVLYIMEERRNPNSKHKDWLGILPKDWSEQVIFYTEEELSWLKGSDFVHYIRNFRRELETDYELISRNIPDFSN